MRAGGGEEEAETSGEAPGVGDEGQAVKDGESGNEGEVKKERVEVKKDVAAEGVGKDVAEVTEVKDGEIVGERAEGDGGEIGAAGDAGKLETGKAKEPEVKLSKAARKKANRKANKKAEEEKEKSEEQVLEEAAKAKESKTLAHWKENAATKAKND